jgi:hypothetical protein
MRLLSTALAVAAILPASAAAQNQGLTQRAEYVPGEVIVKFKPGVAAMQRTASLRGGGARLERSQLPAGTVLARVSVGEPSSSRSYRATAVRSGSAWG